MKWKIFNKVNNENGAALWSVIVIISIVLFIITSSFTYLLEHRKILQMRLQQMQATEIVKNGVVLLKNKIVNQEQIIKGTYHYAYINGTVSIRVYDITKNEIMAKISGSELRSGIQTYDVRINTATNKITYFVKSIN